MKSLFLSLLLIVSVFFGFSQADTSGTYPVTITAIVNGGSISNSGHAHFKVTGNEVTVDGRFSVNAFAADSTSYVSKWRISLPFPITTVQSPNYDQVVGTAMLTQFFVTSGGMIYGDTPSHTCYLQLLHTNSAGAGSVMYHIAYTKN